MTGLTPIELIAQLENYPNMDFSKKEIHFYCWWYGLSTESRKPSPSLPLADYVRSNIGSATSGDFAPTRNLHDAIKLLPNFARWSLEVCTETVHTVTVTIKKFMSPTNLKTLCYHSTKHPEVAITIAALKFRYSPSPEDTALPSSPAEV